MYYTIIAIIAAKRNRLVIGQMDLTVFSVGIVATISFNMLNSLAEGDGRGARISSK